MARPSEALCRRDRSLSAAGLRFMPAAVVARRNRNCLQLVLVASSLSPVATVRALWPPGAQRSCRWCDLLPPYVRAARSVCWMPVDPASSIVHALKYEGWSAVGNEIAERMSRLSWPKDVVDERTALIPIPLASARKRQRGYNQSALIARGLARRWRIPVWEEIVLRSRETSSQTKLTPEQRLDNVAGSFRIDDRGSEKLRGAHLVIVDDVVTTAATLNTCATALFESGARIISYVTFGRAHASGDRL